MADDYMQSIAQGLNRLRENPHLRRAREGMPPASASNLISGADRLTNKRMRPLNSMQTLPGIRAFWVLILFLMSRGASIASSEQPLLPPQPLREFRGAWIATVSNLNWPSKPGLTSAQQQAELIALLDKAVKLKLNAIIFQVRPACDALYQSSLEPWSEYLSGQMGKPPEPLYDPLTFAVQQAHRRGLELHAWFNPYRARQRLAKSTASSNHISKTRPHLVRPYGSYLWLDPGERAVQEHSLAVILDVLRRYDIDGIHLDDYFYPYQEKTAGGKWIPFPDEPSWKHYLARGGKMERDDWRRKNVDDFIQSLYQRVKAEKPWVKVGISPFGIWRPGSPSQITGLDAYARLYADSRGWLMKGWLDYCAPQLYWGIRPLAQSYPALLDWWVDQNVRKRHIWPGNNATKVGSDWKAQEILDQVRLTRKQPGATGNVFWNLTSLASNRGGLGEAVAAQLYSEPALVPAFPWLDAKPPAKPRLNSARWDETGAVRVSWESEGAESAWLWLLQTRADRTWKTEVLSRWARMRVFGNESDEVPPELVAISAVDRTGNVGPPAVLDLRQTLSALPANTKKSKAN